MSPGTVHETCVAQIAAPRHARPTGITPRRKRRTDVRPNRAATISLLSAFVLLLTPGLAGARSLLLSGSTAMFPLVTQLGALYHKDTHQPAPRVGQGTSGAGIDEVAAGRVDIADVSRDPIIGVDPKGLVSRNWSRLVLPSVISPNENAPLEALAS